MIQTFFGRIITLQYRSLLRYFRSDFFFPRCVFTHRSTVPSCFSVRTYCTAISHKKNLPPISTLSLNTILHVSTVLFFVNVMHS